MQDDQMITKLDISESVGGNHVLGSLKFCKSWSNCSLNAVQSFRAQNDAGLREQFGTTCETIK
jgi:hypothetical protein